MKRYAFIDYATQAYLLVVGVLIAWFHNETTPRWGWLLAGHVACVGLIHGLLLAQARWPRSRVLDFLRHFYPILLYTAFYRETGELNRMFHANYLDAHFVALEQRLCGFQPCLAFMDALPYLAVAEVFYASYFSYYLMISGVGLVLFLRDRRQYFHYVSVVSFVFYVCYLIYICLPVMGPRVFFREIDGFSLPDDLQALAGDPGFPDALKAGVFYRLMGWIYRHFEGPGAAFPSSHVAIALVTVWFSFKYLRPIRWLHLTVALLLAAATVYCRYHYLVDVLAGAITALVLVPIGDFLYHRFERRRSGPGASPS